MEEELNNLLKHVLGVNSRHYTSVACFLDFACEKVFVKYEVGFFKVENYIEFAHLRIETAKQECIRFQSICRVFRHSDG